MQQCTWQYFGIDMNYKECELTFLTEQELKLIEKQLVAKLQKIDNVYYLDEHLLPLLGKVRWSLEEMGVQ